MSIHFYEVSKYILTRRDVVYGRILETVNTLEKENFQVQSDGERAKR
jgi:hypothetical protein